MTILKLKQKEVFLMTAEAKHIQAKLNEVEADALDGIAKCQQKINDLQEEVAISRKKREVLKQKLERLKLVVDSTWEK